MVKWDQKELQEKLGDLYLNTTLTGEGMRLGLELIDTSRGALMRKAKQLFGDRPSEEIRKAREAGKVKKALPVVTKEEKEKVLAKPIQQVPVIDRPMPHRRFAESELPHDQTGWVSSDKQPSVFKAPNGACQWWLRNVETRREKPCGKPTEDAFCKDHKQEANEYIEARRNFNPASADMFGTRRRRK